MKIQGATTRATRHTWRSAAPMDEDPWSHRLQTAYNLRYQQCPFTIADMLRRTGMRSDDMIGGQEPLEAFVRDLVTGYWTTSCGASTALDRVIKLPAGLRTYSIIPGDDKSKPYDGSYLPRRKMSRRREPSP
jgi:hypothetical protein